MWVRLTPIESGELGGTAELTRLQAFHFSETSVKAIAWLSTVGPEPRPVNFQVFVSPGWPEAFACQISTCIPAAGTTLEPGDRRTRWTAAIIWGSTVAALGDRI